MFNFYIVSTAVKGYTFRLYLFKESQEQFQLQLLFMAAKFSNYAKDYWGRTQSYN